GDLARGRDRARRPARGVVRTRRRDVLPPHPAAPAGGAARRFAARAAPARVRRRIGGDRMRMRRTLHAAAFALIVTLLTGCVTIPTGGGVATEPIRAGGSDDVIELPDSPRPGAS